LAEYSPHAITVITIINLTREFDLTESPILNFGFTGISLEQMQYTTYSISLAF